MNRTTYFRAKLVIIGLCLLLLSLTGVRLYIGQKTADESIVLGNLQNQIEQMKVQNSVLKEKILQAASLLTLSQKAHAEGFVPAKYFYLK